MFEIEVRFLSNFYKPKKLMLPAIPRIGESISLDRGTFKIVEVGYETSTKKSFWIGEYDKCTIWVEVEHKNSER